MIFINNKRVEVKDLPKRLGVEIPIDKLTKKPMFEIAAHNVKIDPANGPGATKVRQSMDFPTLFRTELKNGESLEIRYASDARPDPKTNGTSMLYTPKMVTFDGRAEYIKDSLDKAVYFFLHFFCKSSPFNKDFRPEYDLVNDQKRADEMIQRISIRGKAVSHVSDLADEALYLIAKGLRIQGIDREEPDLSRAILMQWAENNPAEYLAKANSQVNNIQGLIIDSIDKGIFKMENRHNQKVWSWGEGESKGVEICQYSSSVQDDVEALLQHVSSHINEYLPGLLKAARTMSTEKNLEDAVSDINIMDELGISTKRPSQDEVDMDNNDTFLPLPGDKFLWPDFMEYAKKHLGSQRTDLVSKLRNGVMSGEINAENIAINLHALRNEIKKK